MPLTALLVGPFAQEAPDLNTEFVDFRPYWGLLLIALMFGIGVMAVKAAKHGAQKGEPAKLGGFAICAIIVIGIWWIGSNVLPISQSDTFNQVGRTMKVKAMTTTTR